MPSITRNLNVVARCGNQFRSLHLAPLGITAFQAPYLLTVESCPGVSQERLSGLLHVNKSSAARQLAALEELGMLERRPDDQDRRVLLIMLTEKGAALCPKIREVNRAWQEILTRDLSEQEKQRLDALLAHIRIKAAEWAGEEEAALENH